tara:strand:+ start:166 stop:444 length:279 start_codon:yes stop_codon:yes gene_type:complete
MKNGLRSGKANPLISSGYTLSRSYSQNATTLYSEILLLVKSGKREWTDQPWQFQLSLSEEYNLEASINYIEQELGDAYNVEQLIIERNGVPA